MNPSADIYLREQLVREKQSARVEYELWDGRTGGFEIKSSYSAELVIAKLLFASRDPAYDPEEYKQLLAERRAAAGLSEEVPVAYVSEVEAAEAAAAVAAAKAAAQAEMSFDELPSALNEDARAFVEASQDRASAGQLQAPPRWVEHDSESEDEKQKTPLWESPYSR